MDAIIEKKNINVAYLIAERLEKERGFELSKYMYMGPIITKIVKGMGLLKEDHVSEYTVSSCSLPFDLDYCRIIWLISIDEQKQCYWKNSKQMIPGCFLTKKRVRGDRTSPEVTRDGNTADRAEETRAPPDGTGAGTSETRDQSVVSWMDPVTPLTQYYTLHTLQATHHHQTLMAKRFGLPDPEPLLYRCGPPPPPYSYPPFTTNTATAPISVQPEPVYSVHASVGPPSQPQQPSPQRVPTPRQPDQDQHIGTSYQQDRVYIGTDAITFSGLTGMMNLGPIPSSDIPSEQLLRHAYQEMLEDAGVTTEILAEWGFDDPLALPAAALRNILKQHKLILSESGSQKVSSGQQSVAGPPTVADSAPPSRRQNQGSPPP